MSSKLALLSNFRKHLVIAGLAAAAFAASLNAQDATFGPKIISSEVPAGTVARGMFYFNSDINVEGKVVAGAPFSATETTTLTQTLANGTHIVQKQEAFTARDSAGRTRREQNLSSIGPWPTADNKSLVFINDPVAKAHYVLEPDGQTAVKTTLGSAPRNAALVATGGGFGVSSDQPMTTARSIGNVRAGAVAGAAEPTVIGAAPMPPPLPPPGAEFTTFATMDSPPPGAGVMIFSHRGVDVAGDHVPPLAPPQLDAAFTNAETLPIQLIEGVKVEGKRRTTRITAGTIGNDQDIVITSEVWYSPELQTEVLLKRNDPRVGESVMSLTNIQRSEPDPSLFQVPAGYTVKDTGSIVRDKPALDASQAGRNQ